MNVTETYRRKLIEVAIPLESINKGSAYEKMPGIGPHPRGIHLWWARRPHVACRSILFAQLVDDPSSHPDKFPNEIDQQRERERLFKIIMDLADWKNSNNDEILRTARGEIIKSCNGELPAVYDPFSGGCSIPLEAQRLGLHAYGSDLNPVAVMIGKAMIEIPPKFKDIKPVHPGGAEKLHYKNAEGLAEDVRYYAQWMCDRAFEKIGQFYPRVDLPPQYGGGTSEVIAWLWTRTVVSPDPSFADVEVPIAGNFALSTKKGKEVWIEPDVDRTAKTIFFRICGGADNEALAKAKLGTKVGRGANFTCLMSGAAITPDYIKEQGKAGKIGQRLMAIVAEGNRGRIYLEPNAEHEALAKSVSPTWKPEIDQPNDPRNFWTVDYGLTSFGDLFTSRQLAALSTFGELVHDARNRILEDAIAIGFDNSGDKLCDGGTGATAYAEAVSVYLAFALDRAADFNNSLTGWRPGNEKIMYLFNRQTIPMVWDFGEANILGKGVGSFKSIFKYQSKCLETLLPYVDAQVFQSNAVDVQYPKNCAISTDPPYYDNIAYSDLSDFFYSWMRQSLHSVYPNLFSTLKVPKEEELVATPYRHGGKSGAENFFLEGMTRAIQNIAEQASNRYPTTIYYAFKQSEISSDGIASAGWATFLQAVIQSGLSVLATWPVRSEQTYRMTASGTNALATSVVLVCRQRHVDAETITRAEFIRALKQGLPPALHELQKANITPVDMPQASIGPGIGIFSRYKVVLESDDSPMAVKTALQIINHELDAFLTEQEGEFDADTRFAVTWFEQNGMKAGNFGDADNLARARGVSVDSVKHAGIIESAAGKVRILERGELDDDWTPADDTHLTIWECTQYLIRALQDEGEFAAAVLLKQMGPDMLDAARDLAYRLFDICDKQGRAKEASAYNALIAIWPDLTAQAATISGAELGQEQFSMI